MILGFLTKYHDNHTRPGGDTSTSYIMVLRLPFQNKLAYFLCFISRGFIQERAWQKEQGKPVGETHLYFGCRHKAKDFIYREELEKYASDGVLSLHTAFSRDQDHKIYVTHRMRENMDDLWRLIGKEGAHVYVCGDAKMMAKDVHNIVTDVIEKGGEMSREDAEKYVKKMEQQKRYSADVWS